jgi:FG-GAP-like repeat
VKANAVVALDANADGITDLFFGGDKVSHLLIGKKGGGFVDESATRLPDTFGGTQDVAVGDINRDGVNDLVLGNEDRNQLYLGSAQGKFRAEALPIKELIETRDVELFDANGDGLLDVYLANVRLWNPRAVLQDKLLLGTPNGLMEASMAWLPPREESTLSALPFDYDQDGKTDLLLSTLGSSLGGPNFDGRLILLRNTGSAFVDMSQAHLPANLPGTPGFDVVSADFDGDKKPDIFVSGRIGPDLLLLTR